MILKTYFLLFFFFFLLKLCILLKVFSNKLSFPVFSALKSSFVVEQLTSFRTEKRTNKIVPSKTATLLSWTVWMITFECFEGTHTHTYIVQTFIFLLISCPFTVALSFSKSEPLMLVSIPHCSRFSRRTNWFPALTDLEDFLHFFYFCHLTFYAKRMNSFRHAIGQSLPEFSSLTLLFIQIFLHNWWVGEKWQQE